MTLLAARAKRGRRKTLDNCMLKTRELACCLKELMRLKYEIDRLFKKIRRKKTLGEEGEVQKHQKCSLYIV